MCVLLKRLFTGMLGFPLILGCMVTFTGNAGVSAKEQGDVDGDGSITSTDARLVLQIAVNKIDESDVRNADAADVDGDGGLTTTDARLILQKAVGKIDEFPYLVPEDFVADTYFDATAADEASQVVMGTPAPDKGAAGFESEDGYLLFRDVDFGQGDLKTFMAVAAVPETLAKQKLTVRLNSLKTTPVASVTLTATGGEDLFAEQYAHLSKTVTGVHDVYICAPKGMRLDGFIFSAYAGQESAEDHTERMAWWNDARFGMFIHWGAYANYPFKPNLPGGSEWVMDFEKVTRPVYEQRAVSTFNPVDFDAKAIVDLAKDAGQKYIVFTSKHHEGFSMFETHAGAFEEYSLLGYGTYKGADPLKQLANASRAAGLPFGCYYSIMDWSHPANAGNWGGMRDKEQYVSEMKAQLRELIQQYDLDILWFDGEWHDWWTAEDGHALYRYLRTLKPSLIINNRVGKRAADDGDFGTPEQEVPATGLNYDWESCITMNNSWGYYPYDNNWKSPQWIIQNLVDTASKGGNLLLNVGPDNQGAVPAACASNMRTAGQWLATYGESIYGTTASPFEQTLSFGAATKKDGALYLHVLQRPSDGKITIPALRNKLLKAEVLGSGLELQVEQGAEEWSVTLPSSALVQYDTVIRLQMEGVPSLSKVVTYSEDYALNKPAKVSNFYQNNAQYNGAAAVDGDPNTRWATDDRVTECWLEVDLQSPATFNSAVIRDFEDRVLSYNVEYWDGDEWKIAYTGGFIGARSLVTFPEVTADKVRLHILSIKTGNGPSIWEFGIYTVSVSYEHDS